MFKGSLKLLIWGGVATSIVYYTRQYFAGNVCTCGPRLDGKVIIITGANSGIGKEVATELALRGATIWLACRDIISARVTCEYIIETTKNSAVNCLHLDLNSFQSVRQFAKTFQECSAGNELYALVNNAGVFYYPPTLTEDGFDVTFQTNYLGPFLLTHLLLDDLRKSTSSRIINVSSEAHRYVKEFNFLDVGPAHLYNRFEAYGNSKLCLMLFTHKLAQLLKDSGVTINAVNPGNVETNVYRHFSYLTNPILSAIQWPIRRIVVKSPLEGAQSVLHSILCPNLEKISGVYISDCQQQMPSSLALNNNHADFLWNESLMWCQIHKCTEVTSSAEEEEGKEERK